MPTLDAHVAMPHKVPPEGAPRQSHARCHLAMPRKVPPEGAPRQSLAMPHKVPPGRCTSAKPHK
eukprot:13075343-Alexandrium_andersonii.AAC.1